MIINIYLFDYVKLDLIFYMGLKQKRCMLFGDNKESKTDMN